MSYFRPGAARSRKSLILIAFLLALSLVAAACGEDAPDPVEGVEDPDAQEGGTLVFGAEQEPANLNPWLTEGNLFWTSVTVGTPTLAGTYTVTPDFSYVPYLLDGEAEVVEDPFSITYTIREEAQWSDGVPITAEDLEFTWETIMNEDWDIVTREGYDRIESAEIVNDKEITFHFSEPYAPWRDLFSSTEMGGVMPKHELEGENFNRVWNDGPTVASGPFVFESWDKGSQLTIVRNDNWWGPRAPYLDEVVFRFVEDTSTEIQQIRGGEVDAIYPQPQLQLAELTQLPDIEIETSAGTVWEHYDFQFANELLGQDFVRQAIAHGIDRNAILSQLFADISPELEPLDNVIYMTNQEDYQAHFDRWDHNPERARELLEENGCTEGADGIFECNGERLSFSFITTAGNELRELQFEIVQAQLQDVGIELTPDLSPPEISLGRRLPNGNFDIIGFAWVGAPDPSGAVAIFSCEGGQNYNNYCNEEATRLLRESDGELDESRRADLLNQADELMAEDLPVLPLYQKPTFFAWNTRVHGMQDNATNVGPTWNIQDWWIEQ